MGDFEKDLKSGAIGERVAWDLLIKAKNARSVVDVRDDRRFQQYDVDFLCEMADRNFKWFEVKTDFRAHETGNLVFETSTSGNDGCSKKTEADFIMYYLYGSKTMLCIAVKALKSFVKANETRFTEVFMGDYAKGFLVPIRALEDYGIVIKKWEGLE